MKAQKKTFWFALVLTFISFAGIILLFLFAPEDRVFFEILKVIAPSLSMGLLVSVIMSFVFHRNEKDKYMKRLYDKAQKIYGAFHQSHECVDITLGFYHKKGKVLEWAEYTEEILEIGYDIFKEEPIYLGEYAPLYAPKKMTKIQKNINDVLYATRKIQVFSNEIDGFMSNLDMEESNDTQADHIFQMFFDFKDRINVATEELDFFMGELEERYKFDHPWNDSVRVITDMVKNKKEHRKFQRRRLILDEIKQRQDKDRRERKRDEVVDDEIESTSSSKTERSESE